MRKGAGPARHDPASGRDRVRLWPAEGDRSARLLADPDPEKAGRAARRRGGSAVKKIRLYAMAHARSGDKGDGSNVGVLAYDDRGYEILAKWLTPERVKAHFGEIVRGRVERYRIPNL